jgi:hypothetical protein
MQPTVDALALQNTERGFAAPARQEVRALRDILSLSAADQRGESVFPSAEAPRWIAAPSVPSVG